MSVPVSARWYPTLTRSHNVAVRYEILSAGVLQYQSPIYVNLNRSPGTITAAMNNPFITGGQVTISKQASVRSQLTMTLVDPTGTSIPLTNTAPLTPWGHQIRVYRGIAYPDGTYEMPRLGTFRITDVNINDQHGGATITVTGQDLARIPSRNLLTNFYQTATSSSYTDVIRAMMTFVYPGVVFNDTAANWLLVPPPGIGTSGTANRVVLTDALVPMLYQDGADLWAESRKLAQALSCDLYFNRDGVLTLVMDPNLNFMAATLPAIPIPVATFVEGSQARFIDAQRTLSDTNAKNAWLITGEGQVIGASLSPIQSKVAIDNDPNSPTYHAGPYGTVSGIETNALLKTQIQCDTYASWRLRTSIGAQEVVQFDGFVDTSLDVDDPIAITRQRLGLNNSSFIIDSLTFPLMAKDKMSVGLRAQRRLT